MPDDPIEAALGRFFATAEPARTLIATDFDGTLSAIVPVPADARPLPGVVDALTSLVGSVLAVAIVSGRSQADLDRLLPVPGLRRLGDYGRPDPAPEERTVHERFAEEVALAVRDIPGSRVEAKPGSTSIHFRDNPAAGPTLVAAVTPLAHRHGLDVRQGRMVVEVVPGGWDKARALESLVAELRPGAVLFAGDDHGDRGCFTYCSTLQRPHLAIGVASAETAPEVFADCDVVVDGPEANVRLLSRLAAGWARRAPGRAGRGPGG